MQLRPVTTAAVLVLVVASVLLAGCTTTTTEQNQTISGSETQGTATNGAFFLQKYLAAHLNVTYSNHSAPWVLVFNNNSSAYLDQKIYSNLMGATMDYNETFTVFPTTQDATNYWTDYLKAMNATAAKTNLSSKVDESGTYQQVTGHAPQTYKMYLWTVGDLGVNRSAYRLYEIQQFDNLIQIATSKVAMPGGR
jgi:hypothetical protein